MVLGLIALVYFGGWVFAVVACAIFCRGIYEELRALEACGHKPLWWVSFASLLISVPMVMLYSYLAMIPILTLFSFCALLLIMRRQEPELVDVMVTVLPIYTLVLPGMCIFGILSATPYSLELFLMVQLFAISIGGDTGAYYIGSLIGGHKLCPRISPHKTVSGAVGGLLISMAFAVLVGIVFQHAVPDMSYPPFWANMLVGLFGGAAGQIGDLFASMIKRHCGVKDFSKLLPGHGGMMDRLDSIVFAAVVVFSYRLFL